MKFKGFNLTVSWKQGRCTLHLGDLLIEEGTLADFDALCCGRMRRSPRPLSVTVTALDGNHEFHPPAIIPGVEYAEWHGQVQAWSREDQDHVRLGSGAEDVDIKYLKDLTPADWDALEALREVVDGRDGSEKYKPCLLVELREA